jgi:hypothetical protein
MPDLWNGKFTAILTENFVVSLSIYKQMQRVSQSIFDQDHILDLLSSYEVM